MQFPINLLDRNTDEILETTTITYIGNLLAEYRKNNITPQQLAKLANFTNYNQKIHAIGLQLAE